MFPDNVKVIYLASGDIDLIPLDRGERRYSIFEVSGTLDVYYESADFLEWIKGLITDDKPPSFNRFGWLTR